MMKSHHGLTAALVIALVACLEGTAYAQFNGGTQGNNVAGRTALENASAGGAGGRSPGNLVISGASRAQAAIVSPRFGFSITETSRPISPRAQFLAQAIQIIFTDLNVAISLLQNVLLARAGLPPALPGSSLTSPALTGGSGGAVSTGNAGSSGVTPGTVLGGSGSTGGLGESPDEGTSRPDSGRRKPLFD